MTHDEMLIGGLIILMVAAISLFCLVAVLRMVGRWVVGLFMQTRFGPRGFDVLPPGADKGASGREGTVGKAR